MKQFQIVGTLSGSRAVSGGAGQSRRLTVSAGGAVGKGPAAHATLEAHRSPQAAHIPDEEKAAISRNI